MLRQFLIFEGRVYMSFKVKVWGISMLFSI